MTTWQPIETAPNEGEILVFGELCTELDPINCKRYPSIYHI